MKIIRKDVGTSPVVLDVEEVTLKYLQDAVEGYIEYVLIGPDINVVCNENAIAEGKEFNCAGILGNLLILAHTEDGEVRGLTDEELRKALRYLEVFATVPHPGESIGFTTLEEIMQAAHRRDIIWERL